VVVKAADARFDSRAETPCEISYPENRNIMARISLGTESRFS